MARERMEIRKESRVTDLLDKPYGTGGNLSETGVIGECAFSLILIAFSMR